MKTNTITERNRIVETHLWCIDAVMQACPKAVHKTRMEHEDIYQQLALRLVQAVDRYDPVKAGLVDYIFSELKAELRDCAAPAQRPTLLNPGNIIPFEAVRQSCLGIA